MEPGEYAVRGGILDLFPPGRSSPVRLDFFGDTLEHIKAFDPDTQRTGKIVQRLTLMPVSEITFGEVAEKRFRRAYVETFGPATGEDPLYEAVSAGQRYPGMEHWLPLFHERLETLFDYVGDAPVTFDHLADQAVTERLELIADHHEARVKGLETLTFGAPPYKPVAPAAMFLTREDWSAQLAARTERHMTPFEEAATRSGRLRSFGAGDAIRARALARASIVRRRDHLRAHPARPGQAGDPRRLHAGARERTAGLLASISSDPRRNAKASTRRRRCLATTTASPCSASSRASRRRRSSSSASRTSSATASCARAASSAQLSMC
jgi:transcription-repair coupling factor (superfamily II helicase)